MVAKICDVVKAVSSPVLNNIDDGALHLLKPANSTIKTCIRFLDEDEERRTCLRNVTQEAKKKKRGNI